MEEQQLEELLTCQLQDEDTKFTSSGSTNAVTIDQKTGIRKAAGSTVCLPIKIGGVNMEELVDTGSQSTIISRSMLLRYLDGISYEEPETTITCA